MAMAAIETDDMDRYLEMLRSDPSELDLLAKDLLINVTSFFRDPKVFDLLAEKIVPDLVRGQPPDQPLASGLPAAARARRPIPSPCCSASRSRPRSATSSCRSSPPTSTRTRSRAPGKASIRKRSRPTCRRRGLPASSRRKIAAIGCLPELRASVVFTVQDVLADPPFSRLDLVSCRNLLIYLRPEAQAKVVSLFHFALREGGILLLGSSETVGNVDGRFEVISKPERLYRHIGRSRPGELGFSMSAGDGVRVPARPGQGQPPSRQVALADFAGGW